ncbi:MAG: hypothetical protein AB8H47_19010 [Bacteroidia bacterium]
MRILFLLCSGLLVGFYCYSQNDANVFDEAHSLRYANHLRASKQYQSAALEYERVLFFSLQDTLIQQFLLDSYFRAANYDIGLTRAQQLYPSAKAMPASLAFTYGKLLLRNGNHLQLSGFLDDSPKLVAPNKALLQIGNSLITRDWELAQSAYQTYQKIPQISTIYGSLIERSQNLPRKSPFVAMSLSLVVPGLGKVYTNQWKDGIIALLSVGSFAFTAWRSYNRNGFESPFFWLYGGIALGFYGGNLYGSWQSAQRYNEKQIQSLIHDTEAVLYPRL